MADERGKRLDDTEATRRSLLEALQELCSALRQAGDLHALTKAAARASDLARLLGDEPALMIAQVQAGHAAFGLGQRDSAEESLRAALELADALGDPRAAASARQELLRVLQAAGHLDEARAQGEELLAGESWWSQWAARVALAAIDEQAGNLRSAEDVLDEAEQVIASGDEPPERVRMAEVYVQSNRVNITLARGRYAEARQQSDRMHELAAEAGLPDQVREATLNSAIAALRTDDLERAGDLLARLREWAELAGDRRMGGLAAVFEAERLVLVGEPAEARRVALEAIETGNGLVNGQMVAEAELLLGMAFLADGLAEDALHHLRRCRDRARRLRLRRLEVAACVQHGLALAAADEAGAEEALRESLANAREHGYEDLLDRATQALDEISDRSGESEQ